MKRSMSGLLFLVLVPLIGCAGVCRRDEKLDAVLMTQSKILSDVLAIRAADEFKSRLLADPVLVQQEAILASALTGVLNSQQEIEAARCGQIKHGGKDARY